MISLGNIEIAEVRHGGVLANGVYLGSTKLWPEDAPVPVQADPVKFVANEAGATVGLMKNGSPPDVSLVYSLDGRTWSDYTIGQTFTLSNAGDIFCIRAKTTNSEFSGDNYSNHYYFSTTGDFSLMGNINTLLAADGEPAELRDFIGLFEGTTITDASGFELPSMVIGSGNYSRLFMKCSSLVVGPKRLPALSFSEGLPYYAMFKGCTSLRESPVIDIEIGRDYAMGYMF